MQTMVIGTVANSLPENEVILLIFSKLGNGKKERRELHGSSRLRDSYRIQTYNLLIRSQMLYSVELTSRPNNCNSKKVTRIGFKPITF